MLWFALFLYLLFKRNKQERLNRQKQLMQEKRLATIRNRRQSE